METFTQRIGTKDINRRKDFNLRYLGRKVRIFSILFGVNDFLLILECLCRFDVTYGFLRESNIQTHFVCEHDSAL